MVSCSSRLMLPSVSMPEHSGTRRRSCYGRGLEDIHISDAGDIKGARKYLLVLNGFALEERAVV